MVTAYKYVIDQKGVALGSKYPYKASDKYKCYYRTLLSGGTISSYETIERGNETLLQVMLAKYGPIAIAGKSMQS